MKSLDSETIKRQQRRHEGMKLQEIENKPLSAEEKRMFEMFDREGRNDEQRRAYILKQVTGQLDAAQAAE